jgi:uncharacterized protein
MRNLFIAIVFLTCFSCKHEETKNFVVDRSNILDSLQVAKLNALYLDHEKKTTNQMGLLTIDDISPDSSLEQFALKSFNELGIGRKDINNGVLIVFSEPLHEVRITTGLGTEKVLTDDIVQDYIDNLMLPQFKQGKYFEGFWKGSVAITQFLEKPENKIK